MAAPILATKLFIPPPPPKAVLRPRLIERLNEGLNRKLVLVSASAGFGKTTLLSEWIGSITPAPPSYLGTGPSYLGTGPSNLGTGPSYLGTSLPEGEGKGMRVAWLSLDDGDNDPTRFLTYFIAALQTIEENFGNGVLADLQSHQPPPIEAMLTNLVNEITSISDSFILVLDDYHVIDSKAVDQALTFLVEHLPPRMHLVIASREDPALPLARLRVRGQLTELRAADLRFTPAEAAEFLNQVMSLNLSAEDIAALESRTEGWIAGLQLAALSMQGQQDSASFIKSFTGSHHFVLDYLLEEVLQLQSESVQNFLLRTSILERLCSALCEAVLGSPSASGQETLEYLERANLFIVPLDNERGWYRYHHLFGDLLRQRLGLKLSPGEIAETHLRASQWHEENGDLEAAFQHTVAAGDFGRAAGLAESAWQGMDDRFQTGAWLGWVKKLPVEVIGRRPVLNTQMGLSLMDAGEPEASESRLREAEGLLNGSAGGMVVGDEAQLKPLPAMIAMARAYNAQVQGNLSATVKYAELALQHLPEDDYFRRAQATITLEMIHWASGDLDSARSAMGDWMNSMQKAGNFVFVVASASALADILVEQGQLREAEKTYLQALQLAAEHGNEAQQITAHHYLGLAMLHHEMGKDASAAEHLQKAHEMGEQTTLVDWPYRRHLAQARLEESRGDLEAALIQLDQARGAYVKNPIPDTRPIEALKARVYLKQGRLARAQDWRRERGLSADDEISYLSEFEHLTLARVLMTEYQSREGRHSFLQAIGLLERLLIAAEAQRRTGSVLSILVVQALAQEMQGNRPLALVSLERALLLAQPEGYVRLFVDEGEPMRLMISDFRLQIEKYPRHAAGKDMKEMKFYTAQLLAAFSKSPNVLLPKSKIQYLQSEILPEPLSERELEVLRLVAQGLTNDEISQRLVLALSTVKGHNLRIFAKLQAKNRSEAVTHARELGLL